MIGIENNKVYVQINDTKYYWEDWKNTLISDEDIEYFEYLEARIRLQ